jgi:hypothetical protein
MTHVGGNRISKSGSQRLAVVMDRSGCWILVYQSSRCQMAARRERNRTRACSEMTVPSTALVPGYSRVSDHQGWQARQCSQGSHPARLYLQSPSPHRQKAPRSFKISTSSSVPEVVTPLVPAPTRLRQHTLAVTRILGCYLRHNLHEQGIRHSSPRQRQLRD